MNSSVLREIPLCTSPDFNHGIVPLCQKEGSDRDGVAPDLVSVQNSETVVIDQPSGNNIESSSACVLLICAAVPTDFSTTAMPVARKLSFNRKELKQLWIHINFITMSQNIVENQL